MKSDIHNKFDINTLVSRMLMGEISEEEAYELLKMAEQDPSLKLKIKELMDEDDFLSRYQLYNSIDVEKAKAVFMDKLEQQENDDRKSVKLVWMRRMAVAAAVALLMGIGWLVMNNSQDTKAPIITAELTQAMNRVQQNGMNGATLIINGKTIKVDDAKKVLEQAKEAEGGNSLFGSNSLFASDEVTEGTLVTQKNKEFWVVLDDGTYVHLNYNSKLTYPNRFVGSERRVKLKGEAYFVVANDSKKRPFIVETANGLVHDYGTEFNVNTMRQEGVTSVVLIKGKVGVSSKFGKEYLLKPGEMATLQMGRTPEIDKVDVNLYTSWNTGNFFFDGCSLKELMQVVGHWYNMKIEFASDDIQDQQFTGSIDKYEPMVPTLNAIEKVTGLRITTKDNIIVISHN